MNGGSGEVGCGVWGSGEVECGEVGKWGSGEVGIMNYEL
ncbi:hypothetical protein MiTa_04447 [Microcystis aeruginosa NIES-4264]|nr:hypothetical protein MiTa_04447 [Microcystis aeruginosa NIES-4264]